MGKWLFVQDGKENSAIYNNKGGLSALFKNYGGAYYGQKTHEKVLH